MCPLLKMFGIFNIKNANKTFDILQKDIQLKLFQGQKILAKDNVKNRKYCKYHNLFGQMINNCVHFRDVIEKAIKQGQLKFVDKGKKMIINKNPFPTNANFAKPLK